MKNRVDRLNLISENQLWKNEVLWNGQDFKNPEIRFELK